MKKIVLLISFSILFALAGENLTNQVSVLEQNKQYLLARQVLAENLNGKNKIEFMKMWMDFDKKLFNQLMEKSRITELTKYLPPEEWSTSKKTLVAAGAVVGAVMGAVVTFFTGGLAAPVLISITGSSLSTMAVSAGSGVIIGGAVTEAVHSNNSHEKISDISFYLIDLKEAKEVLSLYNILKTSQINLHKQLETFALAEPSNQIIGLMNEQSRLKKEIKERYQNYISYTIVSPYLAFADYQIFVSNEKWIGHDYDKLEKAAKAMAKGAYKDILLESNEDVRDQFYRVFQRLKNTAGDKEWEDLRVVQTLVNSSSISKKTGIDIWWK